MFHTIINPVLGLGDVQVIQKQTAAFKNQQPSSQSAVSSSQGP